MASMAEHPDIIFSALAACGDDSLQRWRSSPPGVGAGGESRRRRGELGKEQRGSPSDDGAEARKGLTGSPSGGGAGHVRRWRWGRQVRGL
jgi:hypothetical protein